MFQRGIFLTICIVAMTASAWSDEPSKRKQIVLTQLPEERWVLPIAQEAAPGSLAPVSLEELDGWR